MFPPVRLNVITVLVALAPEKARSKNVSARMQRANTVGPVYSRGNRVTENCCDSRCGDEARASTSSNRCSDRATARFPLD